MLLEKNIYKKIKTYININACLLFLLTNTSCVKKQPTEAIQLQKSIKYYINKTPNKLYNDLGKPATYYVETDKNNKITKAKISYEYIYNFKTKTNDCIITFTTDKTQNKIISASYNSEKCHYIFR